jgi:hypothetical protein
VAVTDDVSDTSPAARTPLCRTRLSETKALPGTRWGYIPLLAYGWSLTTWVVNVALEALGLTKSATTPSAAPMTSRSLVSGADVDGERSASAGREAPLTSASKTKRSRGGEAVGSLTNWRDWSNGRAPVAHGL